MSSQIPVTYVNSFASNVWHLAQQKGSRLSGLCRNEMQNAEKAFYDYIGTVASKKRVGRHVDVTYTDTPHGRRACFIEDYELADLVDKQDKLRMIYSPENEYAVAHRNGHGRTMDDVMIAAALGTSYSGKDGTTPIVLPAAQKIAAFDGSTTTGVGLNVKTLRKVKRKFDSNEVEGALTAVVSANEIDNMLGQLEVASEDYNSVKALVAGAVDTFMGFKFIRIERLPRAAANTTYTLTDGTTGTGTGTLTAATSRRCIFFEKSGMLFAKAEDIVARIDELPTKGYSAQVYSRMTIGATRMEEVRVVEVLTYDP